MLEVGGGGVALVHRLGGGGLGYRGADVPLEMTAETTVPWCAVRRVIPLHVTFEGGVGVGGGVVVVIVVIAVVVIGVVPPVVAVEEHVGAIAALAVIPERAHHGRVGGNDAEIDLEYAAEGVGDALPGLVLCLDLVGEDGADRTADGCDDAEAHQEL